MSQNNQKSITHFLKSNQKQQNFLGHESPQKSEAQVPTHKIKVNDKPFHPPTAYVFSKSKSGNRLRPCQAYCLKKLVSLHYDHLYQRVIFHFFLIPFFITLFEVSE